MISKERFSKKEGVSLIVLVITVVVIIILAVAVILSIADNNPITNAREAVDASNEAALKEAANLAYASWYADKQMNKTTEDATTAVRSSLKSQGFSDNEVARVTITSNGAEIASAWDGTVDTTWYNDTDTTFNISKPEQLAGLAKIVNGNEDIKDNFEGKIINLKSNIHLNNLEWTSIGIDYSDSEDTPFKGEFNGNNKVISGMNIQSTKENINADGLFGLNEGTITNVKIDSSCINSKTDYVAFITGVNYGTINNCITTNVSFGTAEPLYHAGIVSWNLGTVENCYNTSSLTSASSGVGGICAMNDGIIESCYNTGNITNSNDKEAGGIASSLYGGSISNCYNTGTITGSELVGGIVGSSEEDTENEVEYGITNCYNIGAISGDGNIGSILGFSYDSDAVVTNCYYLDTLGVGGINKAEVTDKAEAKTETELKSDDMIITLGATNWKKDTNNKNGGYPILLWQ